MAYLYVDTFTAPADCLQDPRNRINSRMKVLKEFFLALRTEGILPTFILVNKDAGQIAAINEAWCQTANIQPCLWHIERAIDRKLDINQVSIQHGEQLKLIDNSCLLDTRRT